MKKVKKQHYVPKFYLSYWSLKDNESHIFVFNKELKKVIEQI